MTLRIYCRIAGELHYFSIAFGPYGIYFKRYLTNKKFYIQIARSINNGRGQKFWYSVKNPYR